MRYEHSSDLAPGSFRSANRHCFGAFSVGPGSLDRRLGVSSSPLLRLHGLREIGTGAGILALGPRPWLWTRIGGNALDIATLLLALRADNPRRGWAGVALDVYCALNISEE